MASQPKDADKKKKIRQAVLAAVLIALLVFAARAGWLQFDAAESGGEIELTQSDGAGQTGDIPSDSDEIIGELFRQQKSGVQVTGRGEVYRLLADDDDGDRHQRFLIRLASGHTLLIAHNIDIAPRAEPLAVGDTVEFCGEYYYDEQGGGVHWTHHDPDGNHADGWLRVNGETFS